METLSCSLSLAFLAEVTGRGYQREGFSGFLRAITVTERAIARSVDCECPISVATSDSLRSSSVRAIALRLANSLPNTDTSRLVPRPFLTLDPYDWERVLITQYGSTVYIACRASGSRCALGPLIRLLDVFILTLICTPSIHASAFSGPYKITHARCHMTVTSVPTSSGCPALRYCTLVMG